ncbi:MAG: helix-turn-helix domain-containing protein, partial [Chloroflexi bacterium]|nr:helix-turn-helix domain-containing protein [Chloroflexota bacterium]
MGLRLAARLRRDGARAEQYAGSADLGHSQGHAWRRRLLQRGPLGLEDGSHRPKRPRRPRWTPELAQAILALRQEYPHWGKEKLVVLLRRQG